MHYTIRKDNATPVINYTVEPGDSLWKIAQQFKTTPDEIIKNNNLDTTAIYPGQVLHIPTQAPQGMILYPYTTQANDTLEVIANKYGISPNDIKYYNDMNGIILKPNQTLYIPLSKTYTIQSGDTLESILKKFNLTLKELVNLNPQWLQAGKVITVRK